MRRSSDPGRYEPHLPMPLLSRPPRRAFESSWDGCAPRERRFSGSGADPHSLLAVSRPGLRPGRFRCHAPHPGEHRARTPRFGDPPFPGPSSPDHGRDVLRTADARDISPSVDCTRRFPEIPGIGSQRADSRPAVKNHLSRLHRRKPQPRLCPVFQKDAVLHDGITGRPWAPCRKRCLWKARRQDRTIG